MSARYKTGKRKQVLRRMAEHAIRDQEGLIDSHTPWLGQPSAEAVRVINNAKANILDYRRISATAA